MFSFIFGKPKVAPAPARSGPSESTLEALRVLSSKESDLDKRITMLMKQVEHLTAEAVTAHKAGMKTKAILAMKKKAAYEEQIKTNTAMMMRIVEQKTALESTVINADTLAAIGHANVAIKAEQSVWNTDRVKDLIDDTEAARADHQEIVDLLREPIGSGPSEEDLSDELDAMMAAATPAVTPAPALVEPVTIPVLPAVPTGAVGGAGIVEKKVSAETEMDRELERLVALS